MSYNLFFDSCIFFDYFEDDLTRRTLDHLKNDGHRITTSITVVGEIFWVCISGDRINQLQDIIDLFKNLDVEVLHPAPQLRGCCLCIDEFHEFKRIYGSSVTDRTHLAYAIVYDSDYFVTSGGEISALRRPDYCPDTHEPCYSSTEVVNIQMLRQELGYT